MSQPILSSRYRLRRVFVAGALLAPLTGVATDPSVDALLPLAPEIRQIFDQRCVMCHGEVIDDVVEIREDLDLSTDEKIRETLVSARILADQLAKDEMPQKAKLSFRLRRRADMQERLKSIKEEYEVHGEKAVLLNWLAAAGTPATVDEK
jgi:hypothetical protein